MLKRRGRARARAIGWDTGPRVFDHKLINRSILNLMVKWGGRTPPRACASSASLSATGDAERARSAPCYLLLLLLLYNYYFVVAIIILLNFHYYCNMLGFLSLIESFWFSSPFQCWGCFGLAVPQQAATSRTRPQLQQDAASRKKPQQAQGA